MSDGVISKEQFEEMTDISLKLNVLFGTEIATQKTLEGSIKKTDERFKAGQERMNKIEKKALRAQIKDKSFSGAMGIIGGYLAGFFNK